MTFVVSDSAFHRGQSGEMALFSFLILTSLCIAGREALSLSDCGVFARRPGKMPVTLNLTVRIQAGGVVLISVQM